jgi:hypothetical protein
VDFVKDCGMVYETVRRVAYHGEVPRNDTLLRIAQHLERKRPDKPIDREVWLRVAAVGRVPKVTRDLIGSDAQFLETPSAGPQSLRVPLLGDVPGPAYDPSQSRQPPGIPIPVGKYGVVSIRRANEERTAGRGRRIVAFRVAKDSNDSGKSSLNESDTVIVDGSLEPTNDDLVVTHTDEKYEVYEYLEAGDGAILVPHTAAENSYPQAIAKDEPECVVGVVIGRWAMLAQGHRRPTR